MSFVERAHVFECDGETLVAISTVPDNPICSTGVLVIVGGPQYRVGSHRQFVHLCRILATRGIPSMRFDVRGMGDSSGEKRAFFEMEQDVAAAIDCFCRSVSGVDTVVLWGLCDGASVACFYAPDHAVVSGLVLLNPWVRTESSEAKTYLKHYYVKRVFDSRFWKKLWNRQVAIGETASNFFRALGVARSSASEDLSGSNTDLPSRMAAGVERAKVPLLVVLSGNDYVANEFDVVCREHRVWRRIIADATVERLEAADHTFSTAQWRHDVADKTASWILDNFS